MYNQNNRKYWCWQPLGIIAMCCAGYLTGTFTSVFNTPSCIYSIPSFRETAIIVCNRKCTKFSIISGRHYSNGMISFSDLKLTERLSWSASALNGSITGLPTKQVYFGHYSLFGSWDDEILETIREMRTFCCLCLFIYVENPSHPL